MSSKRERAKLIGSFIGGRVAASVSTGAAHIADRVTEAHDQLTQRLHENKHNLATQAISADATHVLHVEVLAASDLHEDAEVKLLATCDAYCVAAVGRAGDAWESKCRAGKATTRVIPRQRNPRWGARLEVPLQQLPPQAELTVRAMDSKTIRADQALGETSIDLSREPTGAGCRQLKCSGFATLSLRWALRGVHDAEVALPLGSSAFQQACAFWMAFSEDLSWDSREAVQAFAEALRSSDGELADELIVQAPLTSVLFSRSVGELVTVLFQALAATLPSLSVFARARLAGVLMEWQGSDVGTFPSCGEQFLYDLVRGLSGSDLVEFKRLVGTAGHGIDVSRLVHRTLSEPGLRAGLRSHFEAEAARLPESQLHVLCDVDMTFWVGNFGHGGPKFPQGAIPGARPLLRALGGQLSFLTARPKVYEPQTRRDLLEAGIVEAGILGGDLGALLQAAVLGKEGHAAMGEKKAQKFNAFKALHPEARFVFIGDSGEADIDFATGCLLAGGAGQSAASNAGGVPTCTALIHDVVDETGISPRTPQHVRAELLRRGVMVFDSYAGAALRLHELGLLSAEGLRAAAQGCHEELQAVRPLEWASEAVYLTRCAELLLSLDKVDEALARAGLAPVQRQRQRRGASSDEPPQRLEDFTSG